MSNKLSSIIKSSILSVAILLTGGAWATDYTFSNVDSDSLASWSDPSYGTQTFQFKLNAPSAKLAVGNFPSSGYVQLTSISLSGRSNQNDYKTATKAILTNDKTLESYTATVAYNENAFSASMNSSLISDSTRREWTRVEVLMTFSTDGVLVDTDATYTLTFKNASDATVTMGYSVVKNDSLSIGWTPAMRIYGRTPSGSMEMPSSLIPSSGGMTLPSTVTVTDATGMAFANDSVTIGNSGIQIALESGLETLAVMVKAVIPSSSSRLIAWKVSDAIEAYTSYTGSQFEQHFLNNGSVWGTTYGTSAWTRDASEHWLAVAYDRGSDTSTYLDGANKITDSSLKWGTLTTSKVTIGGTAYNTTDAATGMVIKDVQIYNQSLGYQRIAKVTAALNKGWTADQTGVTVSGVKVPSLGGDIEAGAVTGTATIGTDGTVTYTDSTITELYAGGADAGSTVDGNATLRIKSASSFNTGITLNTGYATGTKALVFDGGATLNNPVIGNFDSISGSIANLYLTGSSITIGNGVDLEVTTMLRTTHAGASACSITQTSGSLTCSGPANDSNYKLGAFVLSHWGAITTYTLSGGSLTVNNSTAKFGADGTGNMTISGTGVANFHSLSLRRGTLTVAAGGTLNLGAAGQTTPVSRDYGSLVLNGGTMGAWNSSAITISVPVTVSGDTTIRASTVSGDSANIIFTGAITGSGNLTIAGGGKVVFAGDMSGFTGSFAVTSGTLEVPSGVSVTSVAAGAEVMVKTSTSPASLETAISGGYSLSGSLTIPETVGGTLTFVDSSGSAVLNPSSTWENDVRTFTGTAPVNGTYTGNQWVWDYEFNGSYASIGSDTTVVNPENSGTQFTAADASGNQELYFQKTPYRGASFSSYTEMTAVMYCAPGDYADKVLVGFGSTTATGQKAISLVTGANPASGEMKLVLTDGQAANAEDKVKVLANLTAVDATTKKHLYAFVMDRIEENSVTKTRVRVYMDGKVKAIYKHNGTLALSDGFQIGSIHGGVAPQGFNTGLTKYPATGDSGTLDFLRVKNAALSDGAMAILANTYPYESAHGEATRDPLSGSANTWVSTDAWTQTVPGEDDATQSAPNADTNVKLSIDGSSAVSVALNLEDDSNYESVTFSKEAGATGSLKVTSAYNNATTGKLVSAETSVLVDTTVPAGRVHLGITSVGDGVTLTVDPYSTVGNATIVSELEKLSFGETYEDEIISMAILGEGASVTLDAAGVSRLATVGFAATLIYDDSNQSYTFRATRVGSSEAGNISVIVGSAGVATWVLNGVVLPTPVTIPEDYANTVTIDASAYDGTAEIPTAFAGGNVTVSSGSVNLTGAITTSGNITLNGATTLSGTSTIAGAVSGSATLTVSGDVTVASTGSIANTIAGDGTLTFEALPASALTFSSWTGTVVLPHLNSIAGDTFSFNSYGIEGSTVRVSGIDGGWLKNEEVNPTIDIPEDVTLTISDFSPSFNNTFKALSGAGTFAVTYNTAIDTTSGSWYSGYSAYFLVKNVSNFTGSLSTATPGIAIGSAKPRYQTAGGKIYLASDVTLTVPSTSSIAPALAGEGRVVFERALPSNTLKTSLQDENNWTGTVELKNYDHPYDTTVDFGIINLNNYGNKNSMVAMNNVTSTMYATGTGTYPAVTLKAIEICEGGWTDWSTGSFTVDPTYTANLIGNGTITIKTGNGGTVKFIGNHTFDGSVAFGDSTGKRVAFMKTSSDTLPDTFTAKSIAVAGGLEMSIASGKTWTAPGGIKIDGTLTVLTTEKASATSVTPTAYVDGDPIDEVVDAIKYTTTYKPSTIDLEDDDLAISNNQAMKGAVTVSGTSSISGSGGAYLKSLTINDGATLTYDPVITPLRIKSAPVFTGSGKLKLASRYAGVTCGKFHLVSYPSSLNYSAERLQGLVDSSSFNNATYTVTEEPVTVVNPVEKTSLTAYTKTDYKQLVLKIGDYDTAAKPMTIAQFGDSITEGIFRNGYRGTPNYRIPLMQLLEAYGYKPVARGYREVGSEDANGVKADDNYAWHTGISAQRIYTGGSSLRAGFMESIEAHLEQVGVTDIITLKIGTNDALGGESAANMFEGWSNLVWKVVRMRPTSKIVVCAPIMMRSGENNAPGLRTKIAEYVAKTAAQGGFPDGQVALISGEEIVTGDANDYLDNVHPNWNGHMKLANAWLPAVTNAFESMKVNDVIVHAEDTYIPQPSVASAETVAELASYRAGYVKLATFTNVFTKVSTWDEPPYTWVNDNFKNVEMSRVAYFVARKTTASPDTRYVWVDMDADATTGTTLAQFCVPTNASVNGVVNNLHIYSNSSAIENVAPDVSGVKGTLMRTEKGVSGTASIEDEDAPAGVIWDTSKHLFDWNDSIEDPGAWGVLSVARKFDNASLSTHRQLLGAQMLFDFNGFNSTGENALGIGNFAVHGQYDRANSTLGDQTLNWTFKVAMPTMDASALDSGVIEIWGKLPTIENGDEEPVGYMDNATAIITNTTSAVTIPASATSVDLSFSAKDSIVLTSTSVNLTESGKVTVYATDASGAKTSTDITSAFKVTAGDNNTYTVKLDDTKTVNGVKVKPEVDTEAETAPMAFDSTAPVFTIKTIPGLWYVVASGSDLESLTNGTPEQADDSSRTLAAPDFDGTVQYYKVKVGPSKASVQ